MTAPAATKPPAMCFPIVGTRGLRITAVDGCGWPKYGPTGMAVSTGVVSIELEPETEDGDDYSQKNAAGQECFPAFTGPSFIKWWNVTIEFCNFDPELFALICPSWPGVEDYARTRKVGWRMGSQIQPEDGSGFALETWPKSAGTGVAQACYEGTQGEQPEPGGYFLLPWVVPDAPDSFTLENEPATFTIKGKTKPGSLWRKGPYNVVLNEPPSGGTKPVPGPLVDPIDPGFKLSNADDPEGITGRDSTHFHGELTTVAPPDFKALGCGTHPLYSEQATAPQITVEAPDNDGGTGKDTTKAKITVSNFADIGKAGTVHWGDGTDQPVPSDSNGTVTKTAAYPDAAMGKEQTVEFVPANNARPVTASYTPKQNGARGKSRSKPSTVEPNADRDLHTIALTLTQPPKGEFAVDWGDGQVDTATGGGPHRHTYEHAGTYDVVTTDETGAELTRDEFTVPKEQ